MRKLTPTDPESRSAELTAERIAQLKSLFPEAVAEGVVDFAVLRELLGAPAAEREERFGLSWHGKRQAARLALTPSTGTLRPCPAESVDWDTTRNLVIEGDNLEVLKLLQKSYAGQVKVIYIDPPYNTGRDFVYPDDYRRSLRSYRELTGQADYPGRKLTSNAETSGRFHSDWLSMLYPRLKLARNLLREDGVLFVSIDDNELAHLVAICSEIFGEENFLANVIWEKVHTRKNSARHFSVSHDYVVCFARSKPHWDRILLPRENTDAYQNPDHDPKGLWKPDPITAHNYYAADYVIEKPNGVRLRRPEGRYWAFSEESWQQKVRSGEVLWGSQDGYPMIKRYLSEVQDGLVPTTLFTRRFAGDASSARREIDELFGCQGVFDYPKPTSLILRLLQLSLRDGEIALDFFAGSGTTGHSVALQNAADGGGRRFILVQLPELLEPANPNQRAAAEFCDRLSQPRTIAELTKERLRRAGAILRAQHPESRVDLGFRVLKLDTTNLRAPEPDDDLAAAMEAVSEPLNPGRSEADLVFELLLTLGFDLSERIEQRSIAGAAVHSIANGRLLACLAPQLTRNQVEPLALGIATWHREQGLTGETIVIFRDNAFSDDVAKANLTATLHQHGLRNVRSL